MSQPVRLCICWMIVSFSCIMRAWLVFTNLRVVLLPTYFSNPLVGALLNRMTAEWESISFPFWEASRTPELPTIAQVSKNLSDKMSDSGSKFTICSDTDSLSVCVSPSPFLGFVLYVMICPTFLLRVSAFRTKSFLSKAEWSPLGRGRGLSQYSPSYNAMHTHLSSLQNPWPLHLPLHSLPSSDETMASKWLAFPVCTRAFCLLNRVRMQLPGHLSTYLFSLGWSGFFRSPFLPPPLLLLLLLLLSGAPLVCSDLLGLEEGARPRSDSSPPLGPHEPPRLQLLLARFGKHSSLQVRVERPLAARIPLPFLTVLVHVHGIIFRQLPLRHALLLRLLLHHDTTTNHRSPITSFPLALACLQHEHDACRGQRGVLGKRREEKKDER
mmetsp:Transcript_3769/g.10819  ORF Transcript_3769/g.10819 Transcript_3769/m.10819 type:complete len:383 (-) Transcript_3769:90-1238(-)